MKALTNGFRWGFAVVSVRQVGIVAALLGLSMAAPLGAKDYPQWRGPERTGVSSETGLLKEWPSGGPKLVWQAREIGTGYSTPAVVRDRIYLLGNEGLTNEFVQALSVGDGRRLWATRLGKVGNPKQNPSFPAARSTPTVEGDELYALGSDGDLACVETRGGQVRWKKQLREDLGGKPGEWAYAESPLIDGDVLVCTPGGSQATLVALKKKSGEVIWKCATPEGDDAAYSSAIVVNVGGVKQYVQFLQKGLVGVDATTGKLLWRYARTVGRYNCNIPTPVAQADAVYSAAAGTGGGLVRLKASDGQVQAQEVYFSPKLPTAIGGSVKVGDYLYGTTGKSLVCVDFASGDIKWDDGSLGAASLCSAEGLLYLHGEGGEVALVAADSAGYQEKGRFRPPDRPQRSGPMEKSWAYPVVADGRLYVRDHGSLWCYEIKAGR